jgi:hypothetical protein
MDKSKFSKRVTRAKCAHGVKEGADTSVPSQPPYVVLLGQEGSLQYNSFCYNLDSKLQYKTPHKRVKNSLRDLPPIALKMRPVIQPMWCIKGLINWVPKAQITQNRDA